MSSTRPRCIHTQAIPIDQSHHAPPLCIRPCPEVNDVGPVQIRGHVAAAVRTTDTSSSMARRGGCWDVERCDAGVEGREDGARLDEGREGVQRGGDGGGLFKQGLVIVLLGVKLVFFCVTYTTKEHVEITPSHTTHTYTHTHVHTWPPSNNGAPPRIRKRPSSSS